LGARRTASFADTDLRIGNSTAEDLYFIINEDLGRRKAKSAEHRIATFKAQAEAKRIGNSTA